MSDRYEGRQGTFALHFFAASVAALLLAAGITTLLGLVATPPAPAHRTVFPWAMALSTGLLAVGSWVLHIGLAAIRVERRERFCRAMLTALGLATLFVGVQSYSIWCLAANQDPARVATGANAFVLVFAGMHGIHFLVALLFLVFVTLRGLADRYDHEYYLGVLVCTVFWHILGIAWLPILVTLLIGAASRWP